MGEKQKQRKIQGIRTDRQISILYKLAIKGKMAISQLSEELNANQRTIEKATDILEKSKNIEKTRVEKTTVKNRSYRITEKGIITLSKAKNVTYEQFWNLVYQIYDKKIVNTKIIKIEFFNNYEKYVCGFDLDNISLQWDNAFDDTYHTREKEFIVNEKRILFEVGLAKTISHDTLLEKINKKYKVNLSDEIINISNDNQYIRTENKKYRLSVLGLLVLVRHHIIDIDEIEELKEIIKNHHNLIPLICKIIPEVPTFAVVIDYLQEIYNQTLDPFTSIQNGGLEEVVYHFRSKNHITIEKIHDYIKAGNTVLGTLSPEITENLKSSVLSRIILLGYVIGGTFPVIDNAHNEKLFRKNHLIDKISDKNLTDYITFEFFCLYLSHYVYRYESPKDSKKMQRWRNFCKKNPKMKDQFMKILEDVKNIQNENSRKMNVKSILSL